MINKHVYQRDYNGCAVAATAMLANVGYFVARRAIWPNIIHVPVKYIENCLSLGARYDEIPCCVESQIHTGMRRLGLKIKHYDIDNLSIKDIYYRLRNDALLMMSMGRDGYPGCYHCYSWDAKNKKLYDPSELDRNWQCVSLNHILNECKYKIVHVIEIVGRK